MAPTASASASATVRPEAATPSATETPKDERATAEADAAKAARDAAPSVKVVDAGAAPRKALRYRFKAGTTEYLEMDMGMVLTMTMKGAAGPRAELPIMRTTMRIDAKELTPEGDLRATFLTEKVEVLKDAKTDPKVRASIEKEVGGLVGMHGKARISPRGVSSETEFDLGPGASPTLQNQLETMRDAIRQVYVPFPVEPVGKGAKWDVTTRLPLGGALIESKLSYTLTKVDADGGQADVEVSITAPPNQPMHLKTLPPGATAILDSMAGHGSGKVSPSFVRLVGSGSSKLMMESSFHVTVAGDKADVRMESEILVTSRPGKAPASTAKK